MSLVITLHDADVGIAVSEGRASLRNSDGTFTPVDENRIKTTYLPDGNILGCTGDGIVRKLRADIEAKAATHTFAELLDVVPELVAEYRTKYPDSVFGVTLMGNYNGRIRSTTWNDRGVNSSCDETITTSTLGCDNNTHDEAATAVKNYLVKMQKDYLNVHEAQAALKDIICNLAQRHSEINDQLNFKYVIAPCGAISEELKPLDNGASTQIREIFDFDRIVSQGANKTSGHVLTSNASIPAWQPESGDWNSDGTTNTQPIPGLGWTAQTENVGDTYNINAMVYIGGGDAPLHIYVDGNTATDYARDMEFPPVNLGNSYYPHSVLATITGLTAGTHTIQFYITPGTDQTTGNPDINFIGKNWATCQRIF